MNSRSPVSKNSMEHGSTVLILLLLLLLLASLQGFSSCLSFFLLHPIPALLYIFFHLLPSPSFSVLTSQFLIALPSPSLLLYCRIHLEYDLWNAQKDGTWALPDCADTPTFYGVLPKPRHIIEKRPCLCTKRRVSPRRC